MPLDTLCKNCGEAKPADRWSEYYCLECNNAAEEARKVAREAQEDPGTAARMALARRTFTQRASRDSRFLFDRVDTSDFEKRMAIERGSVEDPRRQ